MMETEINEKVEKIFQEIKTTLTAKEARMLERKLGDWKIGIPTMYAKEHADKIKAVRNNGHLLVRGHIINNFPLLAGQTCSLKRRGEIRATVKMITGKMAGKIYRIPYSDLIPFSEEQKAKEESTKKINQNFAPMMKELNKIARDVLK